MPIIDVDYTRLLRFANGQQSIEGNTVTAPASGSLFNPAASGILDPGPALAYLATQGWAVTQVTYSPKIVWFLTHP